MSTKFIIVVGVASLAFAAQSYQVFCNFAIPHGSPVTTDFVEYKVDLGIGETLSDFFVGGGAVPASSMYVALTSRGADIGGWSQGANGIEPFDPFTPDASVSSSTYTESSLHWQGLSLSGEGAGKSYYFGYSVPDGTYALVDTGWTILGDAGQSETWSSALSSGPGPVHTLVPEPSTFALISLGIGALSLRRRFRKE